jgi:hypothetical protein
MRMSKPASLEAVLSCAFYHEPRVGYVLPDEAARRDVLPLFFRSALIPATQTCGEIYATPLIDGGSLWISPGRFSAFVRLMRKRTHSLQLKLGPSSFMRWTRLSAQLEKVHRRLAWDPHWYLLALGIKPSRLDGRGECEAHSAQPSMEDASRVLVDPVLSRADRGHRVCYVENFEESHLSFYEDRGFRIAGAGKTRSGGPSFWAMIRTPR